MEKKEKQTKLIKLNDITLSIFINRRVMELGGGENTETIFVNNGSIKTNLPACSRNQNMTKPVSYPRKIMIQKLVCTKSKAHETIGRVLKN